MKSADADSAAVRSDDRPIGAGFSTDIFISYSHNDNEPFGDEQLRWVSALRDWLKNRVQHWLGEDVSVWLDDTLTGSDEFSKVLAQRIRGSAVFVPVFTPSYLNSAWCQRELGEFLNAADGSLFRGARSRVFKVVKIPVPRESLPSVLRGQLGYEFYRKLPSGRPREFLLDTDREARRRYWAKLDDLAQDVVSLLEVLRSELQGRPSPAPPGSRLSLDELQVAGQTVSRCIYLAETTSDLRPERDEIRRDLVARRYRVLPEGPLPREVSELQAAVEAAIEQSTLSIHPIGQRYGPIPEGSERSEVELQLELALRAQLNGGFARLIWLPETRSQEEGRQSAFVERLRSQYTASPATELFTKSVEKVKARIGELLTSTGRQIRRRGEKELGAVRIYLMHDRADSAAAEAVREVLESHGHTVVQPLFEGTIYEVREDHQDNLVLCDAVLVVRDGARDAWLRRVLRDTIKAPGWGRDRSYLAKAVFLTRVEDRGGVQANGALVLGGDGAPPEAALAPFLAALMSKGEGKP